MQIQFKVFVLLFFVAFFTPKSILAQKGKVKLAIFQEGEQVKAKKGVFELKKMPFSIRLRVNHTEGVYLNTSVLPVYYNLGKTQQIPDMEFIHFKVFAEYQFNEKKLLYIDEEGFHFLGYNPYDDWHKLNILEPTRNGFEGYRVIQRLHFLERDEIVEMKDIADDPLYIFLLIATPHDSDNPNVEILRKKYRIEWMD